MANQEHGFHGFTQAHKKSIDHAPVLKIRCTQVIEQILFIFVENSYYNNYHPYMVRNYIL